MYYLFGTILVILAIAMLIWAIVDIVKKKKDKSIIFLLMFSPIIGPLIYFQNQR